MKHRNFTLTFFLILIGFNYLYAQNIPEKIPIDTTRIPIDTTKKDIDTSIIEFPKSLNSIVETIKSFVPKVLTPSPDAAALGRYGEIPVSYSKGSTSVNIPIYEIQSGSLKLPISLSYHSGGVRVNDQASSVGLSWSLNAGGALTRAVNGLPDEDTFGFFSNPIPLETNFTAFMCYIGKVAAKDGTRADGQQDSYFYNYNGNSGRYVYANKRYINDNFLTQKAAVTVPYKPIKINGTTFTTENGEIYQFGDAGAVETTHHSGDINLNYPSTWYLSKMISANKMDTIRFEYTSPVSIVSPRLWSTSLIKKVTQNAVTTYSYTKNSADYSISTVYLSNIYFKNGKINFSYSSDRQDISNAKRLTSIIIYKREASGSYTEIKRFDLTHTYFNGQDTNTQADANYSPQGSHAGSALLKRLKLTAVTEKSAGSSQSKPATQLIYFENHQLPIYGSYAQDFWGFYNGATNNRNLLIKDNWGGDSEPTSANGANRSPSFSHAVTGSLKEIIYPTGGKTQFEYESHVINSVGGGGIRIKSISNFEGSTLLTKKAFSYPSGYITNNMSSNNMEGLAYNFSVVMEEFDGTCLPRYSTYTTFIENYNFMLGSNSGSSIEYSTVEESLTNSNNISIGKTVRNFTQSQDLTSSMFPFASISNDWSRGQLLEEKHYNSSNQIVKQINNYYRTIMTDSVARGYGARATYIPLTGIFTTTFGYSCPFIPTLYCTDDSDPASTTEHAWTYQYLDTPVGSIFTDSTVTITFSENGTNGVREKLAFTYGTSTHHQVKSKTLTNSKNQSWQTAYKYPHEMASSGNVYQEMVNRHIFTPVIEEESKVNNITTRLVRTNYKQWYGSGSSGFIAPLSIEVQHEGGAMIPQIVFGERLNNPTVNGYDTKGRVEIYKEGNGTLNKFTWWDENGKKDLVKTHKVNDLFTTEYDYHSLLGVKTIKNPDLKTDYYEYDAFGRLRSIREENASGAIKSSYCYNYAGQAIDCQSISTSGTVTPPALSLIADPVVANCDFSITASNSLNNPTVNQSLQLSYNCTGSNCTGLTYAWSGNGISGSTSPLTINAPATAGTYTYTVTASKSGCSNRTATTSINVSTGSSGGTSCVVNKVRLHFRGDCCMDRLVGAKIQGSNNNSTWTDLYTFTANGTGSWQEFTFSNTTAYSYVRFVASNNGWGELHELEFYNGTTKLSGTPFGSAGNNSSDNFDKAFDGNTATMWHGPTGGSGNHAGLQLTSCGGSGCSTPSAPTISKTSGTTVCAASSQSVTLTATGCSGGSITWFRGTTQVGTGTTHTTNVAGTYTAKCTVSSCVSTSSNSIVVTETSGCGSSGGTSCVVNKVRLSFRLPGECCMDRLVGAKIQGSNNNSTWTDLYTFTANGTGSWQEFTFSNTTAYSYVRFVASSTGWGELGELEFYNATTKLTGTAFGTDNYQNAFDGNTTTQWHAVASAGTGNHAGLQLTSCGGSGCSTPSAPAISKTSGTTVCAASSQSVTLTATGCSGGSITWFRGTTQVGTGTTHTTNVAGTYTAKCTVSTCVSTSSNSIVVTETSGCGSSGGTSCVVNKVRLSFRLPGECCMDRLVGAKIQGSNNNSTWTDLYTFTANGTGSWQEFTFSNTTAYSYVRFVASNNGWGELHELEFYNGTTKLTGTPFGTAGNNSNDGYEKAFDGNTSTQWHGSTAGTGNHAGLQLTSCGGSGCSTPSAPAISKTSGTTVCAASSQSVTLTATGCSGGSITWFRGTTQVGTGTTHTTTTPGTYTAKCTVSSCTSASSNSIVVTETSGCGSSGGGNCYELYLASNNKRISNHNGLVKVKDADNSNSQIWQLQDMGSGYVKIVSKGSTNGTGINQVLGVRSQGSSETNPVDLQASTTGDHQLWLQTALTGADAGRYKFFRKSTFFQLGSARNWGDGVLSDGESDITLANDPDNIFGNNKIILASKTCPNTGARLGGEESETPVRIFDPEASHNHPKSVEAYPNPVTDFLQIRLNNPALLRQVQIFNVASIQVYETAHIPAQGIDMQTLPAGIYLVKITYHDGTAAVYKIVKQ